MTPSLLHISSCLHTPVPLLPPEDPFPSGDIRKTLDAKKRKKLKETAEAKYAKARVLKEVREKREKAEKARKIAEKNAEKNGRQSAKLRLGPCPLSLKLDD